MCKFWARASDHMLRNFNAKCSEEEVVEKNIIAVEVEWIQYGL